MNPFAQQRGLAKASRGRDKRELALQSLVQPLNQPGSRDQLGPDGRDMDFGGQESLSSISPPGTWHTGPRVRGRDFFLLKGTMLFYHERVVEEQPAVSRQSPLVRGAGGLVIPILHPGVIYHKGELLEREYYDLTNLCQSGRMGQG